MYLTTSITPDTDYDYDYHSGFYTIPNDYSYEIVFNKIVLMTSFFKIGGFIKQSGFVSRKA
jgi:hypothetical protein